MMGDAMNDETRDEALCPKHRKRRFRINRRFDRSAGIAVSIEVTGNGEPLFCCWPLRRKKARVEVPLGDVAEMLLWREAKRKADERTKARAAKRRKGGSRR